MHSMRSVSCCTGPPCYHRLVALDDVQIDIYCDKFRKPANTRKTEARHIEGGQAAPAAEKPKAVGP